MDKKLFIFGTGTIAEIAYYYFSTETNYKICGFVEYKKFIRKKKNLQSSGNCAGKYSEIFS